MAIDRQSVSDILKKHNKKVDYAAGDIETVLAEVKGISTGNLAIDYILGVGGVPEGRSVECYGKPSSGKSTVALQVAANLQREIIENNRNEYILYLDFEHALDKVYTKNLGFNVQHESVILSQPETLEEGAELAKDLISTGSVRLMIWDSVAEAQPKAIVEGDIDQYFIGTRAKLMSQFLQQINGALFRNNCTAIFLNHIQEKIPMGAYSRPGAPTTTTPGGDALKFYSSVRMEFQQIKQVKSKRFNPLTNSEEEFSVSSDVKVKITKNKVADPNRECIVRVRYGKGFDNFWTAIQILMNHKKLPNSVGYYYFDKEVASLAHPDMDVSATGRPNVRGEDNLLSFADEHPLWRESVIEQARNVLYSSINQSHDGILSSDKDELLGGFASMEELEDV